MDDLVARYTLKFNDLASRGLLKVSGIARGLTGQLGQLGGAVGFGAVVKTAADFETAMLGVARQLPGARDETGKLTKVYSDLQSQIVSLGRVIPLPTNELAALAEQGLRSGIPVKQLGEFIRVTGAMAIAFGQPAQDLATDMAKITNVFGLATSEIRRVADVINYLDDQTLATAPDLIEVMTRIGGLAKIAHLSDVSAAALADTFLSLGSRAEVTGTAINSMLTTLSLGTSLPKDRLAALSRLGFDAARVQKGMVDDAQGTIFKVLEAVQKLPEAERLGALSGLFGREVSDDIAKLTSNLDRYRASIKLANSEAAKGSVGKEASFTNNSTLSNFQKFKSNLTDFSIAIGDIVLPQLNNLMSHVGPMIRSVASLAREFPGVTAGLLQVGVAAGIAGKLGILWPILSRTGIVLRVLAAAIPFVISGLGVLVAAVGWPVIAFAALVAGGILLYRNWDTVKGKLSELAGAFGISAESISRAWATAMNLVKVQLNGVLTVYNAVAGALTGAKPVKLFTLDQSGYDAAFTRQLPGGLTGASQRAPGARAAQQRIGLDVNISGGIKNAQGVFASTTSRGPAQIRGSNKPAPLRGF
jgi:TP901 family phage tail tape measure protein